jgi:hypothetical protein
MGSVADDVAAKLTHRGALGEGYKYGGKMVLHLHEFHVHNPGCISIERHMAMLST